MLASHGDPLLSLWKFKHQRKAFEVSMSLKIHFLLEPNIATFTYMQSTSLGDNFRALVTNTIARSLGCKIIPSLVHMSFGLQIEFSLDINLAYFHLNEILYVV